MQKFHITTYGKPAHEQEIYAAMRLLFIGAWVDHQMKMGELDLDLKNLSLSVDGGSVSLDGGQRHHSVRSRFETIWAHWKRNAPLDGSVCDFDCVFATSNRPSFEDVKADPVQPSAQEVCP